jgi:hypothetical protein
MSVLADISSFLPSSGDCSPSDIAILIFNIIRDGLNFLKMAMKLYFET